jgi:hypothetical protein
MATEITHDELLDLEWQFEKGGPKSSIRNYLQSLLFTLWQAKSNFDSKRPFGNSSWEFSLYAALIGAKAVAGTLDSDGFVETIFTEDLHKADELIEQLIITMCKTPGAQ